MYLAQYNIYEYLEQRVIEDLIWEVNHSVHILQLRDLELRTVMAQGLVKFQAT